MNFPSTSIYDSLTGRQAEGEEDGKGR